jgi:hypothetical protein
MSASTRPGPTLLPTPRNSGLSKKVPGEVNHCSHAGVFSPAMWGFPDLWAPPQCRIVHPWKARGGGEPGTRGTPAPCPAPRAPCAGVVRHERLTMVGNRTQAMAKIGGIPSRDQGKCTTWANAHADLPERRARGRFSSQVSGGCPPVNLLPSCDFSPIPRSSVLSSNVVPSVRGWHPSCPP